MTEGVIEQPQPTQTEPAQPEAPISIKDHAAQFGPGADKTAAPETPVADPLKPIRPVDQQRRDQGKFAEGKQRIRGKDAVERINTLTARAKTAEERFAEAESRLATAEAELAQLRRQHASPQQIARAEQKVEQAEAKVEAPRVSDPRDPEPQEHDAKYQGDYGKYLQDHARWAARDEYRQIEARQAQAREQHQKQQAAQTALKTFGQRIDAAKGKYADFAQVALAKPAPWDEGSAIDAFIMEDDNGADVLYYLQHPSQAHETGDIMSLPPLQQLKRLVAISQRFSPSTSGQAGTTGAAAGRQTIVLPPKPPTLVRTEAQHASDAPPPTDGTLSLAEHAKHFGPKRSR